MRVKRELTSDDFTRHYQHLKARFEQLENPLAELQAEIDALRIQALSTEAVIQHAKDLYTRWQDMPFEDKRTVVEAITKQVIIGTHDVTVRLARTPSSPNPTSLQNDGKGNTCTRIRRNRGWLVVISMALPWILPIIVDVLR